MKSTTDQNGARRALVVGIDHYPQLGDPAQLRGAVHDAEQMADLLEHRFGFPHRDLCLLKNSEATRERLTAEMEALVARAQPTDTTVFHWSGHGSQVVDLEGDEPDGLDETLVPVDGRLLHQEPADLRDDEIRSWLARLESHGSAVTLIVDCCHSGHIHRHSSLRPRYLPAFKRAAQTFPGPPTPRPVADPWQSRPSHYVLLAACGEDQLAWERPVGRGQFHGHWTWAILRTLARADHGATAAEIFEFSRACLRSENPQQEPVLVGQRDRLLFGCRARPCRRFLFVDSWNSSTQTGRLRGGAVQGLGEGSIWTLHPPAKHQAQSLLGRARIRRVGALRSTFEAALLPNSRPPRPGDRAFERTVAYCQPRLRVQVDSCSVGADRLRAAVAASPLLRLGGRDEIHDSDQLHLRLDEGPGGLCWWIVDLRGQSLAAPRPREEPGVNGALVRRLERRARCRNVLALECKNPPPSWAQAISLRLLDLETRQPKCDFLDGARFVIEIENQHSEDLYISLLDLGSSDRVSLLHPDPGSDELLAPDLPMRIGHLAGDPLIASRPGDLYPRSLNPAVSHLKLFATTSPVDLSWLSTDRPWRSPNPAPLTCGQSSLEGLLARTTAVWVNRGAGEEWTAVSIPLRAFGRHPPH